jgi:hypothetical protein
MKTPGESENRNFHFRGTSHMLKVGDFSGCIPSKVGHIHHLQSWLRQQKEQRYLFADHLGCQVAQRCF